ncbi:MAG: ribosome-binding factor A [Acidimicrobiales bacterium]
MTRRYRGNRRSGKGAGGGRSSRAYPRAARVNEILRQVLADTLERLIDVDERIGFLTITAVDAEPDLHHATVLFSSLDEDALAVLADIRVRLQAAISQQVRLKRTPLLRFAADPAVATGQRVEDLLRSIEPGEGDPEVGGEDHR